MARVVDTAGRAGPDAIQMNYGQADLLQTRPGKDKPALVMRVDMGNPYNEHRHREMWAVLQNEAEPIIGALEMDAACVVVNLFMLPDEPDLFRQCVAEHRRLARGCEKYGMPLMIEPLVMLPNEERGGYLVDGDAEKIVTLVRLAARDGRRHHQGRPDRRSGRLPPCRGGGARARCWCAAAARRISAPCSAKSAALMAQGAQGMVYGRNIYQHDNPIGRGRGADGDDPSRRRRRRGLGDLPAVAEGVSAYFSASMPATPSSRRCCSTGRAGSWRGASRRTGRAYARARACGTRHRRNSGPTPTRLIRECSKGAAESTPATSPAIGCAGHGNGLYLLDADGEPLLGIQSLDTRAAGLVEEWARHGVATCQAHLPATALAVADADAARLDDAASAGGYGARGTRLPVQGFRDVSA